MICGKLRFRPQIAVHLMFVAMEWELQGVQVEESL
jgi:hypothetical protein